MAELVGMFLGALILTNILTALLNKLFSGKRPLLAASIVSVFCVLAFAGPIKRNILPITFYLIGALVWFLDGWRKRRKARLVNVEDVPRIL